MTIADTSAVEFFAEGVLGSVDALEPSGMDPDDETAHLGPARYAMHRELLRRLSEEDVARLRGASPLSMAIASPLDDTTLTAIVRCTISVLRGGGDRYVDFCRFDPEQGRRSDVAGVLAYMNRPGIVVVAVPKDGRFPLPAVLDIETTLPLPGPEAVRDALDRRFGSVDMDGPSEAWPPSLTQDAFDVACARATSASGAWSLALDLSRTLERTAAAPSPTVIARDGPRLSDLRGYGPAMGWATDLVRDVADFRAGRIPWTEVSPGALMVGPPGTGKSTFAAAVADAASLHLVSTSFSAWSSSGTGHLGDVTKAIQTTFESARSSAPSLVFVDEISTLPARGRDHRHDDFWSAIVNALLAELDGGNARDGFTVLAACNDASRLDPALLRSGRLERHLTIGLPDAADLAAILAQHLDAGIPAADMVPLARILAGCTSGADAASIAREARRSARRNGRAPTLADVDAAALPVDDRPERVRRRVAVHESGHLVAALAQGSVPEAMSVGIGATSPRVLFERPGGPLPISADLEVHLSVLLAGRAAEALVLGRPSVGAGGSDDSDLAAATELAGRMIGQFAFGGTLAWEPTVDRTRVEAALQDAAARAHDALVRHRVALEGFAEALLARRHLGRDEILAIAAGYGLPAGTTEGAAR